MRSGTKAFTAQIPDWLRTELEPDIDAMGSGSMRHGGVQGIALLALAMYASLPQDERRSLATLTLPATAPESTTRSKLDAMWPVRALQRMAQLDADDREGAIALLESRVKHGGYVPESRSPRATKGNRSKDAKSA